MTSGNSAHREEEVMVRNVEKIALCILTYRRPIGLERLLKGISGLSFFGDVPEIKIIIVDNDPAGSSKNVCDRMTAELRWPLQYCIEEQRGIAPARNRALEAAEGDSDWIVFIDDDESPAPSWLEELLKVQKKFDADVVAGPVLPVYLEAIPHWMEKGRFFYRKRYPTGTRLKHAATNNVIFRAAILDQVRLRFDTRFSLMGCDDRHFFQRVRMAGYKIIWADQAVVSEWIPTTRMSARWLIKRQFYAGNGVSRVEIDLEKSLVTYLTLVCKAFYRISYGFILFLYGVLAGRHVLVRGMQFIGYGLGRLAGLAGCSHKQYRVIHGT